MVHEAARTEGTLLYVEVAHDRTLVWVENGKKSVYTPQLADRLMHLFFDLISRETKARSRSRAFLDRQDVLTRTTATPDVVTV
jgi:hypothetical protein